MYDSRETDDSLYVQLLQRYFTWKVYIIMSHFASKTTEKDKFRSFTFGILQGLDYLHTCSWIDSREYPLVKLSTAFAE